MGDYRLAVLEWWHSYLAEPPSPSDWKQSRISWIKIRWCIPHLLKNMFLLENDDQAIQTLLRENGTCLDDSLQHLKAKFDAWSQSGDRLSNFHKIYKCFQCSVLLMGHFANVICYPLANVSITLLL